MTGPSNLGLVDLLIILIIAVAMFGALRHRRGLLSSVLAGAGAAIFCWVIAAAVIAWAPQPWVQATESSALLSAVPPPAAALDQATSLIDSINSDDRPKTTGQQPADPTHKEKS